MPDWSCEIVDVNYEINRSLSLVRNIIDDSVAEKKASLEDEWEQKILGRDFDILGIGGIVPCFNFAEDLIARAAAARPGAWAVVGGGLGLPLKDLWYNTKADYLVEGDAEGTLVSILRAYPDKEEMSRIEGVYHRDSGIWAGRPPALSNDLDAIAYPDWDDVDVEYFMASQKRWVTNALPKRYYPDIKDVRVLPIVMTRGCPYACTFCFHFNRSHRKHSIDYMVDYIAHLEKRHGVNMLQTWDDLIITDRKWFLRLCEALKKRGVVTKIFMSGGKPNLIDAEMVRGMKEAGVVRISYGIESGSPSVLKEMKKMATVEDNARAVRLAIEAGIHTHMNMVIGMPSETEATLCETRDFILGLQKTTDIGSENVSFAFATAYPGTELFDRALSKGLVRDIRRYVGENKGVGNYTLDLCGLGERHLRKFAEGLLIKLDLRHLVRHPSLLATSRVMFVRIPRFIANFYLPRKALRILKKIRAFLHLN